MSLDFLWDEFKSFFEKVLQSSKELPADRTSLLLAAAKEIAATNTPEVPTNLLFVCTHNSRRSQFAQFWGAVAISHFGASNLRSFSCGTEATACNERTIESLKRSGVDVEVIANKENLTNPVYRCAFADPDQPADKEAVTVELFSKAFGHASLPTSQVAAMMCCDDADTHCPNVPGAIARTALHYRDPKHSDGTAAESETYDERSLQIAAEMFFLVEEVFKQTGRKD